MGAMTVAGQRRTLTGLPHFKPGLRAPGTRDLEAELGPQTGLASGYHENGPGDPGAVSDTQRYFALFARLGLTQIAHTVSVQSSEGPPTMRPAWAIQPTFDTG